MNSNIQKMKRILKLAAKTLFSSYNRWILLLTLFILAFYYFYDSRPVYHIFPANNSSKFDFYADSANAGNSVILQKTFTDTVFGFEFILKKGFMTPYAGISIGNQKGNIINLSHLDKLQIVLEGKGMESVGLYLFTNNDFNGTVKKVCFYSNIKLLNGKHQYDVHLDKLIIPDWWFAENSVLPDKSIKPDLKNTLSFNIGTTYTSVLDTKRSLYIYSLSFSQNRNKQLLFIVLVIFIELSVIFLINYFYYYAKKKQNILTINYVPVETKEKAPKLNENFLDYINKNFSDFDLSLEKVAKDTGVHQRLITDTIRKQYGYNLKTYINNLRINEAMRLLKETNFSIGDVSFKTGFNNQSHFNRVFKSIVGKSPSDFRSNIH